MKTSYKIVKTNYKDLSFCTPEFWKEVSSITIENYQWVNNNYKPKVNVKLCYSDDFLYLFFRAYEKEITCVYSKMNDPVHKDSCVEFFVNFFPESRDEYFNFEINAIGTMHVGFGAVGKRKLLPVQDVEKIEIYSTIKKNDLEQYKSEYYELYYKIPFSLFEKYYQADCYRKNAKGNFYKCGDDTKYEHYGSWKKVISDKPNFHLPEYFGDLIFGT